MSHYIKVEVIARNYMGRTLYSGSYLDPVKHKKFEEENLEAHKHQFARQLKAAARAIQDTKY